MLPRYHCPTQGIRDIILSRLFILIIMTSSNYLKVTLSHPMITVKYFNDKISLGSMILHYIYIYLFGSSEILLMHWLNNTTCPRQPCEAHHKNKVSSQLLETLARFDGRQTFFSPSVLSNETLGKLGVRFSMSSFAHTVLVTIVSGGDFLVIAN